MSCPLPIDDDLRRLLAPGTTVLLALSGGVDSALSLAVLRELGCAVQAVTFKNSGHDDGSVAAARRVADECGVKHLTCDVAARFRSQVIEPFVADYAAALTPNPCLVCNSRLRFPELLLLADRAGCRYVATGHYARIRRDGNGTAELWRGVDPRKDQSYFLSQVPRNIWPRVVFPLGWSTKTAVRQAASARGLGAAEAPESQEICFVPDGDRGRLFAAEAARPGPIVDRSGRVLGRHRGLVHYTVGQRRGLGVANPEPLYVLALDPAQNSLTVGVRFELAVRRLVCDRFAPAVGDFPATGPAAGLGDCLARVRYRHAGARVAAWRLQGDVLELELAEPVFGVAPGQGLVLYEGDRVLGGGRLLPSGTRLNAEA